MALPPLTAASWTRARCTRFWIILLLVISAEWTAAQQKKPNSGLALAADAGRFVSAERTPRLGMSTRMMDNGVPVLVAEGGSLDVARSGTVTLPAVPLSDAIFLSPSVEDSSQTSSRDTDGLASRYYRTHTYFTTFTFLNQFEDAGRSTIHTSKETISNVVTIPASMVASTSTQFETETYSTTYTFYKTLGSSPYERVSSTKEVITQVVVTEAQPLPAQVLATITPSRSLTYTKTYLNTVTLYETSTIGTDVVIGSSTSIVRDVTIETSYFPTRKTIQPTPTAFLDSGLLSTRLSPDYYSPQLYGSSSFGHELPIAQTFLESSLAPVVPEGQQNVPALATRTYYTTSTFFTTLLDAGTTSVSTRTEVTSRVATERVTSTPDSTRLLSNSPAFTPPQEVLPGDTSSLSIEPFATSFSVPPQSTGPAPLQQLLSQAATAASDEAAEAVEDVKADTPGPNTGSAPATTESAPNITAHLFSGDVGSTPASTTAATEAPSSGLGSLAGSLLGLGGLGAAGLGGLNFGSMVDTAAGLIRNVLPIAARRDGQAAPLSPLRRPPHNLPVHLQQRNPSFLPPGAAGLRRADQNNPHGQHPNGFLAVRGPHGQMIGPLGDRFHPGNALRRHPQRPGTGPQRLTRPMRPPPFSGNRPPRPGQQPFGGQIRPGHSVRRHQIPPGQQAPLGQATVPNGFIAIFPPSEENVRSDASRRPLPPPRMRPAADQRLEEQRPEQQRPHGAPQDERLQQQRYHPSPGLSVPRLPPQQLEPAIIEYSPAFSLAPRPDDVRRVRVSIASGVETQFLEPTPVADVVQSTRRSPVLVVGPDLESSEDQDGLSHQQFPVNAHQGSTFKVFPRFETNVEDQVDDGFVDELAGDDQQYAASVLGPYRDSDLDSAYPQNAFIRPDDADPSGIDYIEYPEYDDSYRPLLISTYHTIASVEGANRIVGTNVFANVVPFMTKPAVISFRRTTIDPYTTRPATLQASVSTVLQRPVSSGRPYFEPSYATEEYVDRPYDIANDGTFVLENDGTYGLENDETFGLEHDEAYGLVDGDTNGFDPDSSKIRPTITDIMKLPGVEQWESQKSDGIDAIFKQPSFFSVSDTPIDRIDNVPVATPVDIFTPAESQFSWGNLDEQEQFEDSTSPRVDLDLESSLEDVTVAAQSTFGAGSVFFPNSAVDVPTTVRSEQQTTPSSVGTVKPTPGLISGFSDSGIVSSRRTVASSTRRRPTRLADIIRQTLKHPRRSRPGLSRFASRFTISSSPDVLQSTTRTVPQREPSSNRTHIKSHSPVVWPRRTPSQSTTISFSALTTESIPSEPTRTRTRIHSTINRSSLRTRPTESSVPSATAELPARSTWTRAPSGRPSFTVTVGSSTAILGPDANTLPVSARTTTSLDSATLIFGASTVFDSVFTRAPLPFHNVHDITEINHGAHLPRTNYITRTEQFQRTVTATRTAVHLTGTETVTSTRLFTSTLKPITIVSTIIGSSTVVQTLNTATRTRVQLLETATRSPVQQRETATRTRVQQLEPTTRTRVQQLEPTTRTRVQLLDPTTRTRVQLLETATDRPITPQNVDRFESAKLQPQLDTKQKDREEVEDHRGKIIGQGNVALAGIPAVLQDVIELGDDIHKGVHDDNEVNRVVISPGVERQVVVDRPASVSTSCPRVCRTAQNEACRKVGGAYRCTCKPGFARDQEIDACEPAQTYQLQILLDRVRNIPLTFRRHFEDSGTPEHKALTMLTESGVRESLQRSPLTGRVHGVHLLGFKNTRLTGDRFQHVKDGLVAELLVQVSEEDSKASERELLEESLLRSIARRNFSLGDKEIIVSRHTDAITALDFDECQSPDFHDCHDHAFCYNLDGSFTCSCRDGMIDMSAGDSPGRICSAESTSGCAECSYNGECRTPRTAGRSAATAASCRCHRWYAGNKCQINLRVLLIALLAVGAVLALVLCVCCFLCCRNKSSVHIAPPLVFTGPDGFLRHRGSSLQPVMERRAMLDSSSDTSITSPPPMVPFSLSGGGPKTRVSASRTGVTGASYQEERSVTSAGHQLIPRAKHRHPHVPSTRSDSVRSNPNANRSQAQLMNRLDPLSSSSAASRRSRSRTDTFTSATRRQGRAARSVSGGRTAAEPVRGGAAGVVSLHPTGRPAAVGPSFYRSRSSDSGGARQPTGWSSSASECGSHALFRERTMSEARSFEETTVRPTVRSLHAAAAAGTQRSRRSSLALSSSQVYTEDHHTMAERDAASTFVMPETQLFRPTADSDNQSELSLAEDFPRLHMSYGGSRASSMAGSASVYRRNS